MIIVINCVNTSDNVLEKIQSVTSMGNTSSLVNNFPYVILSPYFQLVISITILFFFRK